ncbi:MAG TPA: hypothetical protein VM711_10800, partial [Sphingomicrobium sp.]|nr:hypothetical protein [Sphingomicrobium sp.]
GNGAFRRTAPCRTRRGSGEALGARPPPLGSFNYPGEARRAYIEGSVRMSAVINKNGDIIDLEALDGPIALVQLRSTR